MTSYCVQVDANIKAGHGPNPRNKSAWAERQDESSQRHRLDSIRIGMRLVQRIRPHIALEAKTAHPLHFADLRQH